MPIEEIPTVIEHSQAWDLIPKGVLLVEGDVTLEKFTEQLSGSVSKQSLFRSLDTLTMYLGRKCPMLWLRCEDENGQHHIGDRVL